MTRFDPPHSLKQSRPARSTAAHDVAQSLSRDVDDRGFRHSLFCPLHYERNYAYPLIVWLHGPGDDERQLRRIMPLVSMRNYVAFAPRGLTEDADRVHYDWPQTDDGVDSAQQRVFDGIDLAISRFSIAPDRVFLAGFDGGGTMALRVALAQPHYFAGVLSLGGALPDDGTPFRNLDRVRALPVFLAHGRKSRELPTGRICDDLRLFHVAGMSVTLRQYPCEQEITPKMLADVDGWIMEQITGVDGCGSTADVDLGEPN